MRYLVWLSHEDDAVIVRAVHDLDELVRTVRAYRHEWGGHVRHVEDLTGGHVDESVWNALSQPVDEPLPYLFTVELRTDRGVHPELVTALWTTADPETARRWRAMLPPELRRRALIVTNSPTGRRPRPPWDGV